MAECFPEKPRWCSPDQSIPRTGYYTTWELTLYVLHVPYMVWVENGQMWFCDAGWMDTGCHILMYISNDTDILDTSRNYNCTQPSAVRITLTSTNACAFLGDTGSCRRSCTYMSMPSSLFMLLAAFVPHRQCNASMPYHITVWLL